MRHFGIKIQKKFWGGGTAPSPDQSPVGEGDAPSPNPTPSAPAAPRPRPPPVHQPWIRPCPSACVSVNRIIQKYVHEI